MEVNVTPPSSDSRAARECPGAQALRWMSDQLLLWGLCERVACLRARRCRSDPRSCLSHYAALVPEAARDCVDDLIEAKSRGLTFDEFMAETAEDLSALADWAATAQSFAQRRTAGKRR